MIKGLLNFCSFKQIRKIIKMIKARAQKLNETRKSASLKGSNVLKNYEYFIDPTVRTLMIAKILGTINMMMTKSIIVKLGVGGRFCLMIGMNAI